MIIVFLLFVGLKVWLKVSGKQTQVSVFFIGLPIVLQFLFLIYPIVTRIAFQAFSFHEFDDGAWLRADVRIERGTSDQAAATGVAVLAILLYPVGLLVLMGGLLFRARAAIASGAETDLSNAIKFIYGEYSPRVYW